MAALEVQLDVAQMRQLYVDLKAVEGNLRVELRKGIVEAAKPITAAVKVNAGWSNRIPGAVKTKPSFSAKAAGIQIIVDAKKAPEAAPLENGGSSGTFRHPVYADGGKVRDDWTWVNQQARPFFYSGVRAANSGVTAAIQAVMDTVAAKAGFH